jgi:dTDP-4-dehydrorhamnose reductase
MRVLVTGGAGFVGSNVVAVAAGRGDDVAAVVREPPPRPDRRCRYLALDLLDAEAVRAAVTDVRPDVVVHTAIWNDLAGIYADRRRAWASYVGVTETLADSTRETGAVLVTVSTDWVFDGAQAMADESTPPNPVNYYGVLKAASELVTLERARATLVARVAGVLGVNRAGRRMPRRQDAGFGYFVDAVVASLAAGEPFTVWESAAINSVATPSLATLAAEWMLELAERGSRGIFHCCSGEPTTRMDLARRTADVFGLDASLLRAGPPDPAAIPPGRVPYDTSLDARATAQTLGREPPPLDELLRVFKAERDGVLGGTLADG